jgi:hypothetical protein
MPDVGWTYHLRQNNVFQVPEGYIDFSVAYTVPTLRLLEWNRFRIARIADPFRDQFAQQFANHISRIAVPALPKPKTY